MARGNVQGLRRRQTEVLQYFGNMIEAIESLPPNRKAEFMEWDHNRTAGQATSDWPGFEALIGPSPWSDAKTLKGGGAR